MKHSENEINGARLIPEKYSYRTGGGQPDRRFDKPEAAINLRDQLQGNDFTPAKV